MKFKALKQNSQKVHLWRNCFGMIALLASAPTASLANAEVQAPLQATVRLVDQNAGYADRTKLAAKVVSAFSTPEISLGLQLSTESQFQNVRLMDFKGDEYVEKMKVDQEIYSVSVNAPAGILRPQSKTVEITRETFPEIAVGKPALGIACDSYNLCYSMARLLQVGPENAPVRVSFSCETWETAANSDGCTTRNFLQMTISPN